jgi:hypothetical protein
MSGRIMSEREYERADYAEKHWQAMVTMVHLEDYKSWTQLAEAARDMIDAHRSEMEIRFPRQINGVEFQGGHDVPVPSPTREGMLSVQGQGRDLSRLGLTVPDEDELAHQQRNPSDYAGSKRPITFAEGMRGQVDLDDTDALGVVGEDR